MGERITISLPEIVGGGYKEFWNCRKRYRVVKGGKASKKSSTAALWFIYHLMKYPGANLLVVRNVFNTHRDSTYSQLKWAVKRFRVDKYWRCIENPLEMQYTPNGNRILFRGFDDVDKLASTTVSSGYLCWVWIEEAFEIQSEADFDKLDLSAPRGNVPEPLFKQTTLTFNPWSEKSWLKKRFFDNPGDNVLAMTTNYLCNEWLDEVDRAAYEDMRINHPRKYAVAGLGEWGISEGLIYDRWRVEEFDPEKLPEQWKYKHLFGLDYGYTNDPTAFIAVAVNPIDKLLYIYDEHYQKRMLNSDIAEMIKRKGYAKERIRADSAEPKSNEDIRRMGISRLLPADKGPDSVIHGISRLQEYQMVVHPRCENTIAELSSYIWEQNKGDGVINRPVDADNHLMDALRYAMLDIKYFHPDPGINPRTGVPAQVKRHGVRSMSPGIRADDFRGGWGG